MSIRGRQIVLVGVAVVVAATCVRLGLWQLDRLHGRREVNAMLATRKTLPAADLTTTTDAVLAYSPVTATGTYDLSHEIVLSGRSLRGTAGNHVLTPLVLDGGEAVMVDRGWVPLEVATPPVTGAGAAPAGTVTISGLALPPDSVSTAASTSSVATRIDLGDSGLPYALLPVYVLLATQDPPQVSGSPAPAPPPALDEGPHLSYAIQWFAFAAIAVIGCVVLLRRDGHGPHAAPPRATAAAE